MNLMTRLRRYRHLIAAFAVLAGITMSLANLADAARSDDNTKLSANQLAAIARISAYFNQLRTAQGEFVQSGPGSFLTSGRFYLSKPGKLRFEYAAPNPLLVVADGSYVIVQDRKLQTADHYPIGVTPLKFLLADKVDILNDTKIIQIREDGDKLTLTVEDKSVLIPGRLTLEFENKEKTMGLTQWIIVDGQGQRTTIAMRNIVTDVKPDPALFKVKIRREIEADEF